VTTWAQQVRAVRPVLAATLLSAAGANLEAIIRLAQNNPPTGWRPTGTNRDDSDFDLLLILPDTVPESLTGQATGQVWQTAQTRGHAEDRRRDAVRTGRGQLAARERGQAVRGPGAIVTAPRQHGAIVSAETLDRPHLASSPASWHPMCIPCDARTPLVVKPMQAVSTGPRRARRSILPRGQERWRGGAPLGERTERTDGGRHTERGDRDQNREWGIQRIELSGGCALRQAVAAPALGL
jgi:hypothetical protein